jgi:hypothetical protein
VAVLPSITLADQQVGEMVLGQKESRLWLFLKQRMLCTILSLLPTFILNLKMSLVGWKPLIV